MSDGNKNFSFCKEIIFVKIREGAKRKNKPNWICMPDFLYFVMKET